jgi:DNA-binding NarL/FixJ family response regulator
MEEKKILVVEDEVIVAYDLKEFLESLAYSVQLAHTIESALVTIKTFQPHLCICDVHLGPGPNGIDFMKEARSIHPDLEVIYATAFSHTMLVDAARESGALNYIVKPWNDDQIRVSTNLAFDHIHRKKDNKEISQLSAAEYRIIELIARQKSSREIAELLFLSEKTIRNHRHNIAKKLGLDGQKNSLLKWAMTNIK